MTVAAADQRAEEELIAAIDKGRCVAFVGAGFSHPTVGGWGDLLKAIATRTGDVQLCTTVERLLAGSKDNVSYEAAAQLIDDRYRSELGRLVVDAIAAQRKARQSAESTVTARLMHLHRIPFHAILTTNFDGYLTGHLPGGELYRLILRGDVDQHRYEQDRRFADRLIGNLHGLPSDPSSIVMTRRAYRRRLHENASYRRFLSTLFSTHTVIYLGFSFTDAYINEVRSEVLAMLGDGDDAAERGTGLTTAYAVIPDIDDPPGRREFLQEHEGIRVISYPSNGNADHTPFDALLERLANQTSAEARLARAAEGCRILWLDPAPENNLRAAAALDRLDCCPDVDGALAKLETTEYDLVITHLGYGLSSRPDAHPSVAEELLARMNRPRHGAPVIVFGAVASDHADENKRRLLRAGATAYTYTWDGLFREIDRVLSPGACGA